MTKQFGRNEDRLADMSMQPPSEVYECPPHDQCVPTHDYPIDLNDGFSIYAKVLEHEGRICFYSLQLSARIDGVNRPLSRIDTEHDVVHQHYYRRGTYDPGRPKEKYEQIPLADPHNFLLASYDWAYAKLVDEAALLLERWH